MAHLQDQYGIDVFQHAVDAVEATATADGRAQGVELLPEKHAIEIIEFSQWNSKEYTAAQRQAILSSHCIVICNTPQVEVSFSDKAEMEQLLVMKSFTKHALSKVVAYISKYTSQHFFTDWSLLTKEHDHDIFNPNENHCSGTLEGMVDSKNKIINCLNITLPSTKAPSVPDLATQVEAEAYVGLAECIWKDSIGLL